jgi:hypothetical protein
LFLLLFFFSFCCLLFSFPFLLIPIVHHCLLVFFFNSYIVVISRFNSSSLFNSISLVFHQLYYLLACLFKTDFLVLFLSTLLLFFLRLPVSLFRTDCVLRFWCSIPVNDRVQAGCEFHPLFCSTRTWISFPRG